MFTGLPRSRATLCRVTDWQLACLDMAGTTIRDDGLVEQAFTVAFAGQGVAPGTQDHQLR